MVCILHGFRFFLDTLYKENFVAEKSVSSPYHMRTYDTVAT
jgi:hypothetical protein